MTSRLSFHRFATKYLPWLLIIMVIGGVGHKIVPIFADDTFLPDAQRLSASGIIQTQTNTDNYRLGDSITRAEMAKMLIRVSNPSMPAPTCSGGLYIDVSKSLGDLCGYIEKARALGIVAPNPYYRPSDPLSRAEMTKMIVGTFGMKIDACDGSLYMDVYTTSPLCPYITTAEHQGIVAANSFFRPDDRINRGEAFKMLTRVLDKHLPPTQMTTRVSRDYTFNVTFPVAMNHDATLASLRIYPDVAHTLTWQDNKTATIHVSDNSLDNQNYVVNVSGTTPTASGGTLGTDLVQTFKTDGIPDVAFTDPDGTINNLSTAITVRFSQPMVALTTIDNQPPCPLTITPDLSGSCVWITTSTFQFRPDGGFPIGGHYTITVPSGLPTITGDHTVGGRSWTIDTTPFAINTNIPTTLRHDDSLLVSFNAPVSLDAFIQAFRMDTLNNDDLSINYYKNSDGSAVENTFEIKPKSGDFGYGQSYSYTIDASLTSARGNISLGTPTKGVFTTNDLLTSINAFVMIDPTIAHPYLSANLRIAKDSVIPNNNPALILSFDDPVTLDQSLITMPIPFVLSYGQTTDCSTGTCAVVDDHKTLIIQTTATGLTSLPVSILLSKIAKTQDKSFTFSTSPDNSILHFTPIDYRSACIDFAHEVDGGDMSMLSANGSGSIDGLSPVNQYSNITQCPYDATKQRYLLSATFTPNTTINLTIKQGLLDANNLPLDHDYSYTFATKPAQNEDKSFSVPDYQETILVPTSLHPLSLPILSTNLDTIHLKICAGDLDPTTGSLIKNGSCTTKDVSVRNLGFKTNLSVVDLESVYGTGFTQPVVTVAIDKVNTDKTQNELNNTNPPLSTTYIRSDVSVTLRSGTNGTYLWLADVRT